MGCQLTYHIKDERIVEVSGRDGPANHGRLCVKGRYGFDYVHHRERLTRPLIRRDKASKHAELDLDPDNLLRDQLGGSHGTGSWWPTRDSEAAR